MPERWRAFVAAGDLPAAISSAGEQNPRPEQRPAAAGCRVHRILLVDDDPLVRATLGAQLADRGYDVVQAACGDSALALIESGERVDLLLSDLAMPGMDGIALIRAVRVRRPELPAILLTGWASDNAARAVAEAANGSFALLRKPIGSECLSNRVAGMLEAAAVRGRNSELPR